MVQAQVVTSPSNPRVKRAMKLRKSRERRARGMFLAEGVREVTRAAAAGLRLETVFVCPACLGQTVDRFAAAHPEVLAATGRWIEVPETLLRRMTYRDDPEGVLAEVEAPAWTLESLASPGPESCYLVAVGTEKPGNLGAMVRTAAAAGCAAVLAAGPMVDVFNPNAIRASTGAVFSLPTVCAGEEQVIAWLGAHGVRLLAATLDGRLPYDAVPVDGPLAIAIGPEDTGLSPAWADAAERTGGATVRIPMRSGAVDSLNASASAAVLLLECVRRRSPAGSSANAGGA